MNKADTELIKQLRLQMQQIAETVNEIDEYLRRLAAERQNNPPASESEYVRRLEDEVAALKRDRLVQVPADVFVPTVDEPDPDPRRPYQNQRQPRRDGDSYASVPPSRTGGDTHGTKAALDRQRRRTEREETRPHYPRSVQSPTTERR